MSMVMELVLLGYFDMECSVYGTRCKGMKMLCWRYK